MKTKGLPVILLFLMTSLSGFAQYNTRTQKSKFLLDFCKRYYPDGVQILNYEAESLEYLSYTDASTDIGILEDISTIIHETYHGYENDFCEEWECTGYYFGDGIGFSVPHGKVFKTPEMDPFIADSLKEEMNGRYDPYIVGDLAISAHTQGLYGILEEMNAYYLGAEVSLATWDYYVLKYKGRYTEEWGSNYCWQVSSDVLALHQFRFFIAWYLEYARDHHPDVYRDLMANERLRLAYTLLEIRFTKAEKQYEARLDEFVKKATNSKVKVYLKDNSLWFQEGYSGRGIGVFTEDMKRLDNALLPRWKALLDGFKLKGATEENWREFL